VPVRVETHGRLARVVLDRPPLNVLDTDHLRQLGDAVRAARHAAVLVLEPGEDCRAFSAGNDVKDHARERAPAMLAAFHGAVRALLESEAFSVADVRGDALGGGCELVLACDLAWAAPGARLGQPEVDVGCFPPVAAALLPRRVGWKRAVEILALGRPVDAQEAARIGLVNGVGPAEPAVESLLRKSPEVLRALKAALRAAHPGGAVGVERAEEVYLRRLLPLEDCAEGVRAFLEKRPPRWPSA
jgi:cyclohexa-1,5-dienecarbonyl-CoA hydratase